MRHIFIIPTDKSSQHQDIYTELLEKLDQYASFKVVKYGDWQWSDPEERWVSRSSAYQYAEADPSVDRRILKQLEREHVMPEEVRTEDLELWFSNSGATVLLDLQHFTEGMDEELETLLPMIRNNQRIGSLALVTFGEPSEWARGPT